MNTEPKTLPSYADQLRDALPQHTYHQRGAFGTYTASWTTPAGTWTVARQLKGTSGITSVGLRAVTAITGPDWTLTGPADADTVITLLRLFGALDEAGPSPVATELGPVAAQTTATAERLARQRDEVCAELDRINTVLREAGIEVPGATGVTDLAGLANGRLTELTEARRLLAAKDVEIAALRAFTEPVQPLATGGLIRTRPPALCTYCGSERIAPGVIVHKDDCPVKPVVAQENATPQVDQNTGK